MDIIFRTFHPQNRHRRRTQAESPRGSLAGFPVRLANWLRRTIHESEINHILEHYWSLPPQEFIRACFRDWQVTYSIEGLDKLAPGGRYLPRLEPSVRGHGRHDARRQADRPFRRRAGGGQRPADVPRTAAPAVDSGEPAPGAQSASYAREFRRGVLRRSAGPDAFPRVSARAPTAAR